MLIRICWKNWRIRHCKNLKTFGANLMIAIALIAIPLSSLKAEEIVVTDLSDNGALIAPDGDCSSPCTLREAITEANSAFFPGPDTIILPQGTIDLINFQVFVSEDLEIRGAGPEITKITGTGIGGIAPSRLFSVNAGVDLKVLGVSFEGAFPVSAGAVGGCISSLGGNSVLTFNNTAFNSCFATDQGGAIYAPASIVVNIRNSTFFGNTAGTAGSAISAMDSTINIDNSSFIKNSTAAILLEGTATTNVTNSTFSRNLIAFSGDTNTSATFNHVTFAENSGFIAIINVGDFVVSNSIFGKQLEGTQTCTTKITSNGNNIEAEGDTCGVEMPNTDPMLGAFADDGYYPLLEDSPAIDAIDVATLPTDQLGNPRDASPDIGAIEVQTEGDDSSGGSGSGSSGGSGGGCSLALAGSANSSVAWMGLALLGLLGFSTSFFKKRS